MDQEHEAGRWSLSARAFHWGMALLILVAAPAGWIMGRTYAARDPVRAAWHYWTANVHHSLGLLLLALALLRAARRLAGPVPPPIGSPVERRAARATHLALYALLLLIPLSGWAALSSLQGTAQFPNPLWFFGRDQFAPGGLVPRILPPVAWDAQTPLRYGTIIAVHRYLLLAGAVLLCVHVAAALRHHVLLRDATLLRMLRGSR